MDFDEVTWEKLEDAKCASVIEGSEFVAHWSPDLQERNRNCSTLNKLVQKLKFWTRLARQAKHQLC